VRVKPAVALLPVVSPKKHRSRQQEPHERKAQKKGTPIPVTLMLEAATLVTTLSTEQIVLEMVHAHVATGTDQSGLNG
jgi:hypothetical protein